MPEQKYESNDTESTYSDVYANYWIAQTFTPEVTHKLTRIVLRLSSTKYVGKPYDAVGPFIVSIKAIDEDGKPTGEDLVSKSLIGEGVPSATFPLYFDTHIIVEEGVKYAKVIRYLRTTDRVKIRVYRGTTDSYENGECLTSDDSGDTWTAQDYDLRFEDWGYEGELEPEPKVVSVTTSYIATRMPIQRKCLFTEGLFWVFYSSDLGGEVRFKTSIDGIYWTEPTTIGVSQGGADFSVWLEGADILHYCFGYQDDGFGCVPFSYRKGTLNSDGTISWIAEKQLIDDYCADPVIAVDSEGYPWIAYITACAVGSGYGYVIKSSLKNGEWETANGFPYLIKDEVDYNIVVVPLTNQKMFVTYAKLYGTPSKLLGKLWDGSTWGTEETLSTSDVDTTMMGRFSSIALSDTVHTVFLQDTTYDIKHVIRRADGRVIEKIVVLATSNYSSPVLTVDDATGDLYCFWAKSNHIYCNKYNAKDGVWSENIDLINEETETLYRSDRISAFYKNYEDNMGILYLTKPTIPYNVNFAFSTSSTLHFSYPKLPGVYGKVSERAVTKSDMDAECCAKHGPYYEYDAHLKTCVRKIDAPPLTTLISIEPMPTPKKLMMEIVEPPKPRVITIRVKGEEK